MLVCLPFLSAFYLWKWPHCNLISQLRIESQMKTRCVLFGSYSWHTSNRILSPNRRGWVSGLKVVQHHLTQDQLLMVGTVQYSGDLHYGIPVCYDGLLKTFKMELDVLPNKFLRVVVWYWRRIILRDMLDALDRALPSHFANYATASLILNTLTTGKWKQPLDVMLKNINTITIRKDGKRIRCMRSF